MRLFNFFDLLMGYQLHSIIQKLQIDYSHAMFGRTPHLAYPIPIYPTTLKIVRTKRECDIVFITLVINASIITLELHAQIQTYPSSFVSLQICIYEFK